MSDLPTNEAIKEIDLLPNECAMDFLDFDAITTATIYTGSPPIDTLKARVNEIATLNPWLTGRLLKKKTSQVTVQYRTGSTPEVDFLVLDDLNFSAPAYNPVQHNPEFEHYFVKKGTACLNKNEPLFRVIVAILNTDQFVLFVSLSHAVADGSTYYRIYNMLSTQASPVAMIMEREKACSLVLRSIGLEEAAFFGSLGFIANAVGKIFFHGKHHMAYCRVRPEWILAQKAEYQQRRLGGKTSCMGEEKKENMEDEEKSLDEEDSSDETALSLHERTRGPLPPLPFISTNDILTSAVFKALDSDFAVMPVNYRNRVEGLTADHCGEYNELCC